MATDTERLDVMIDVCSGYGLCPMDMNRGTCPFGETVDCGFPPDDGPIEVAEVRKCWRRWMDEKATKGDGA